MSMSMQDAWNNAMGADLDEAERDNGEKTRPKLLIIGHGRHGKDTVAEMLRDMCGFKFTSSSMFVATECLWDTWGKYRYPDFNSMYADRHNKRDEWADMISEYNTPDKTRTAVGMISKGYDLYVGMRRRDELEACIEAGVFDGIIWVDRSEHLPPEPASSMDLTALDAHIVIDNNGTLEELKEEVRSVFGYLMEYCA